MSVKYQILKHAGGVDVGMLDHKVVKYTILYLNMKIAYDSTVAHTSLIYSISRLEYL